MSIDAFNQSLSKFHCTVFCALHITFRRINIALLTLSRWTIGVALRSLYLAGPRLSTSQSEIVRYPHLRLSSRQNSGAAQYFSIVNWTDSSQLSSSRHIPIYACQFGTIQHQCSVNWTPTVVNCPQNTHIHKQTSLFFWLVFYIWLLLWCCDWLSFAEG